MIEAFRAEVLTLPEDPARAPDAAQHFADGLLVVEDGIVAALGDLPRWRRVWRRADHRAARPCGARLCGYAYPLSADRPHRRPRPAIAAMAGTASSPPKAAFADRAHADAVAAFFIKELLRNGTTSALVFATVHEGSVDALFEAALARNMRMVSGKVLMDLGPKRCATRPKPRAAKPRR
jgi:guanine deaminase